MHFVWTMNREQQKRSMKTQQIAYLGKNTEEIAVKNGKFLSENSTLFERRLRVSFERFEKQKLT